MELILTVGMAGAGKSTKAKELEKECYIRISQDDHGKEGHWTRFNEALVLGHNIVVDRLNFNVEQRKKYVDAAKKLGYKVSALVFYTSEQVCLERCIKRIGQHPTIVDEAGARRAIGMFISKYEAPTIEEGIDEIKTVTDKQESKKSALIIDIDGTLANIDHRLHYVQNGKKEWGKFFQEVKGDIVNSWCVDIMDRFRNEDIFRGHDILLVSGRPDSTQKDTETWLKDNNIVYDRLFMRKRNDFRRDDIVKEIIFDFNINPYYNVLFVVDDRANVVKKWRDKGLVVLQCADGNF